MKLAHNVLLRVFCKEEDDEEELKSKLLDLLGFDPEKQKIEVKEETADLFFGRKMKIVSVFLKKQRHTTRFLERLFSRLPATEKELLEEQADSRLDKHLHFFIRLDKEKLLDGELKVTDCGACFHIDICIAAYPHDREAAKQVIDRLLSIS